MLTPSEAAASQPRHHLSVLTFWLSLTYNTFMPYIMNILVFYSYISTNIWDWVVYLITESGSAYKCGRKWNALKASLWCEFQKKCKCWQFPRLWLVSSAQNKVLIGQTSELVIPLGWSLSCHGTPTTRTWSVDHWCSATSQVVKTELRNYSNGNGRQICWILKKIFFVRHNASLLNMQLQ